MNTIASEAHEAGEREHVGNARTKSSVVDSLDIRVARGKDDSASHEECNSSAEDEPERFRTNLAKDAIHKRTVLEKRGKQNPLLLLEGHYKQTKGRKRRRPVQLGRTLTSQVSRTRRAMRVV